MKQFFYLLLFIGLILSSSIKAESSSAISTQQQRIQEKMVEDIDFIKGILEVGYAPSEWKKNYSGWELDEEITKAKNGILADPNITVKGFQRVVRSLFNSMKDYHVGVNFYSTESASLPFLVQGVNGKYFFSYIDRDCLSYQTYAFDIGDEIVSFNGHPIHEVISEIKENEQRSANEETDQALAEIYLTHRLGSKGDKVPKGPVSIAVRSPHRKLKSYQLIWNYSPEKISNPIGHLQTGARAIIGKPTGNKGQISSLKDILLQKKMVLPLYEELKKIAPQYLEKGHMIGSRESFLPQLGKKIWTGPSDTPYHAYLFETAQRKLIGYIRIPHYMLDGQAAEEFAQLIAHFEEVSDMLVIDQFNNPGGFFFHAYGLAGMLVDEPLITPTHRLKINQNEVQTALYMLEALEPIESDEEAQEVFGETLLGYPINYQFIQFLRHFFQFIIEQWNEGKSLTDPHYVWGVDQINPHPFVHYTKPILVLINQLDFSCGDFFPAILQDNKRVTLFGTRTAGAGGYVVEAAYPNRFGIAQMTFTGSIAERMDSNPIENLGVTPDIVYQLTEKDLQNNYQELVSAILETIKKMAP